MNDAVARALREVNASAKRLHTSDTRIKRKNARRALFGAMKSLRHQVELAYPPVEKPEKERPPKPKREERPRLPFRRAWEIADARLFVDMACDRYAPDAVPYLAAHEGAATDSIYPNRIWFDSRWPDWKKWMQVCRWFASFTTNTGIVEVIGLWAEFFTSPIQTSDLVLAARHQELLEKRAPKHKTGGSDAIK
jgi:hypothetical protein